MTRMGLAIVPAWLAGVAALLATQASAQVLTAERAVQLALKSNVQVIGAEADVLEARSGVYGAYSGVLPQVDAFVSRRGAWQEKESGSDVIGSRVFPGDRTDFEQYSTAPGLSGSWQILNLSSLTDVLSARSGLKAAQHRRILARQEVAFSTRRQFYDVVRAIHLARVSSGALRLSRDDERRVRALFEVGSVSRSDLLTAQVRTAQSELDSLTAYQAVTNQRIALAILLGLRESELGEMDTVLVAEPQSFDRGALLQEAARARPDLVAVDAELSAARSGLRSANFARLPYVAVSGDVVFNPKSSTKVTLFDTSGVELPEPFETLGSGEADRNYSASISLNLPIFNGFLTESRIASARARLLRAQEARDALWRNLDSEVDQTLLAYNEARERQRLAGRALEAATERMKLTQEKYNVGSATILELIDAQVQLQRAQSDIVSALAAIRVAEAQLNRVRGRAE